MNYAREIDKLQEKVAILINQQIDTTKEIRLIKKDIEKIYNSGLRI